MGLIRFPPGNLQFSKRAFHEDLFREIDQLLARGLCPDGWLDLEIQDTRLTCLFHRSAPHLAGLLEKDVFSWVPLSDFPMRARQLDGSLCSLTLGDATRVFLLAVHFRNRPVLHASTDLIDLAYVLNVLTQDQKDAALALDRDGHRTLLFLQRGVVSRLYFGNPDHDSGQGDIRDRFLSYAFSATGSPGKIEVFRKLAIEPDPHAGRSLVKLAEAARPPPPMTILVRLGGRLVLQRPFMPPGMNIGRDRSCELPLDNLSVSRRHAQLYWEGGNFFIKDLESANGTSVNGKKTALSKLVPLDRVGIGKFELALIEARASLQPDTTMLMAPNANSIPAYLVGESISVPLTQEVSIGKAPQADVQARGFFVRPIHARIRPEYDGSFRFVCANRASLRLNGKKLHRGTLTFGDQILVGRSRFFLVPTLDAEPTNA